MPLRVDHSAGYLSETERKKIYIEERRETDLLLSTSVYDVEVRLPYSRRPRGIYNTKLPTKSWPKLIAETYQANHVGSFAGNFDKSITSTIRAGNSILTYEEFVHFRHEPADDCRKYVINMEDYYELETTHKIKSLELATPDIFGDLAIVGPASVRAEPCDLDKILYTCARHGCIFPCLCLLCNVHYPAECEHKYILHPGFFDEEKHLFTVRNADTWNINHVDESLANGNQFCTSRMCGGCVKRYPRRACDGPCPCPTCPDCKSVDVLKYAGSEKQCGVCRNELLDHEAFHLVHHYMCRFCRASIGRSQDILTEDQYWNNLEMDRDEEQRSCHFCYKLFYDIRTMKRHIQIVHTKDPNKLFNCIECDRSFGSKQALVYHDKIDHKKLDLEIPCSICDKTFKIEEQLDKHTREVHKSSQVVCHLCDEIFTRQSTLNHHYKVVHDVVINEMYLLDSPGIIEVFGCPHCEMKTREKKTLNHHINLVHNRADQEQLECPSCQFKTFERKTLNHHMKYIHKSAEQEQLKCDLCEFKTLQKKTLNNHIKYIHKSKDQEQLKCEHCEFETLEKKTLNCHLKFAHSAMKKPKKLDNFVCDKCQFATKEKRTLTHHIKTVHGNGRKELVCKKCNFKTNQLKTLNKHTRTVHKKVFFNCDVCEFRTIDKKELEKHSASQHYQCELCEFKTVFNRILQDHVSKVHPDHIPCKMSRLSLI